MQKEKCGYVISLNMTKTVVVLSFFQFFHKRYKKLIKKYKHFLVHDEKEQCHLGDRVLIKSIKPFSKFKYFYISKILFSKILKN